MNGGVAWGVPERAGVQDDLTFSAWDLLHAPPTRQRISILTQNHYAHYAAAAGSIARQLSLAGHDVTVIPMSWASSPTNSHLRSALGGRVTSFPTPDKQVARILAHTSLVGVEDLRGFDLEADPEHVMLARSGSLSLAELSEIEVRGLPVGSAVRDEVIRRGRGSHPDVRVDVRFVRRLVSNYLAIYHRLNAYLSASPMDMVVVFNGRYVPEAAARMAARSAGIRVAYYEAGGQLRDYDFFGHETHDISTLCLRASSLAVQGCSPSLIEELAQAWFRPRSELADPDVSRLGLRSRPTTGGPSSKDLDVVYFSSSSDELEFNVARGVEAVQRESLSTLSAACLRLGLGLTIRTHPNMRTKSAKEQSDWGDYLSRLTGVSIIDQHADVDAYSLAARARAVATFASTIGIEAMHLGVPTLVTGPAIYSLIPGVRTGVTEEEMIDFLEDMPLPNRDAANSYGAFQMLRGLSAVDLVLGDRDEAWLLGRRVGGPHTLAESLARVEWRVRDAAIQRFQIR